MSVRIQDFKGMQYSRDGTPREQKDYSFFNQQYATSSYQKDHDMYPDLIVQPKDDHDVVNVVKWAVAQNVAVSVKSGGHQYSGASSTSGKNIQIDLSSTYKDMRVDPNQQPGDDRVLVIVGVSNRLKDFNAYLRNQGLFVPTGQCAYVGIGGHAQTGGYGQLGRSFGLFGDHVRAIRYIDFAGEIKEITRENKDLYYAFLGGSPGNFGIATHFFIEAHQDQLYQGNGSLDPTKPDYGGPRGVKGLWVYKRDTLKALLTFVAQMADNPDFARNFDLCVTVFSTEFPVTTLFPDLKNNSIWQKIEKIIENFLEDVVLEVLNGKFPATIVLYAQWCPVDNSDPYTKEADSWFQNFRNFNNALKYGCLQFVELKMPMSQMTGNWLFPKEREFDLPYVKRTYGTKSTTLVHDQWTDAICQRIDLIYNPKQAVRHKPGDDAFELYKCCKLSVQIQNFGGKYSLFSANRDNGTSYSWRDSTILQTVDVFYDEKVNKDAQAYAKDWQTGNDEVIIGDKSPFSKDDRRYLWGSYGDWDMKKVWKYYYEDESKYKRLGIVRGKADPKGTFTPNPFAVEAIKLEANNSH